MKHKALSAALVCAFGLAMTAVQAADNDTDSGAGAGSTNAATPANPNGPGQAATPAMPGNSTAKDKVTANRKKEMENRARVAELREAAEAKGEKGEVNRPEINHPNVSRPEIQRPTINR